MTGTSPSPADVGNTKSRGGLTNATMDSTSAEDPSAAAAGDSALSEQITQGRAPGVNPQHGMMHHTATGTGPGPAMTMMHNNNNPVRNPSQDSFGQENAPLSNNLRSYPEWQHQHQQQMQMGAYGMAAAQGQREGYGYAQPSQSQMGRYAAPPGSSTIYPQAPHLQQSPQDYAYSQQMSHERLQRGAEAERQREEENAWRLQNETERLQQEVERLKKLQKLKQEEEELKRWLAAGDQQQQPHQQQRENHNYIPDQNNMIQYSSEQYDPSSHPSSKMKRRGASRTPINNEPNVQDVESPSSGNYKTSKPHGTRRGGPGGGITSAIPTGILLRKIMMAVITDLDDEMLQREDTESILIVITLLKEAMVGIIIAFLVFSSFLVIDHRLMLNLSTARVLRKASFAVVTDKDMLQDLEDSGVKLMEMEEYAALQLGVSRGENQTKIAHDILDKRSVDLVDLSKEKEQLETEFNQLMKRLGLDHFCGDCMWSSHNQQTCNERVNSLKEKQTPKFQAIMSAMTKDSCNKKPGSAQEEETRKKLAKIFEYTGGGSGGNESGSFKKLTKDQYLADWNKYKFDFCNDCLWDGDMTCSHRADYLNERYEVPMDEAKAKSMGDTERCSNSYYQDIITKMGGFCGDCQWGYKADQTCEARVEFLVYTYRNAEVVARLAAMEKPSCILLK